MLQSPRQAGPDTLPRRAARRCARRTRAAPRPSATSSRRATQRRVTHVTADLGHRHSGVDARLARHHRHVGGVRDDDRALEQAALAGRRVAQFDEVGHRVGELVPAFAAADEHDHVGIAPLEDLLQQHRLPGAETTRNAGVLPFAIGKNKSRTRCPVSSGSAAAEAPAMRSRSPDRPPLGECDLATADARDQTAIPVQVPPPGRPRSIRAGRSDRAERGPAVRSGRASRRRRAALPRRSAPRRLRPPSAETLPKRPPRSLALTPAPARPPTTSAAPRSGRSSPSKMPPSRPGPSGAESGPPHIRGQHRRPARRRGIRTPVPSSRDRVRPKRPRPGFSNAPSSMTSCNCHPRHPFDLDERAVHPGHPAPPRVMAPTAPAPPRPAPRRPGRRAGAASSPRARRESGPPRRRRETR